MKRKIFTEKPTVLRPPPARDLRHPNGEWMKINGVLTEFGRKYFAKVENHIKVTPPRPSWLKQPK